MGAPHWAGAEGTRRLFGITVGKKGRGKKQKNHFDRMSSFSFLTPNNCEITQLPGNAASDLNSIIRAFSHKANHPRWNILQLQNWLYVDFFTKFVQTNKFSRVSSPTTLIIHLQPELHTWNRKRTHTLYMEVFAGAANSLCNPHLFWESKLWLTAPERSQCVHWHSGGLMCDSNFGSFLQC